MLQKKHVFSTWFRSKKAVFGLEFRLISHETVFSVAQTEQFAASEEKENLMLPNEFPQEAAHAHLVLRGEFVTRVSGVFRVVHGMVVDSLLADVVAQVGERGARKRFVAVDEGQKALLQILVIEENMDWVGIVIHDSFVLNDGANIVYFL